MGVRVELEGRLGDVPSVREVNGREFVELSVAVGQGYWSRKDDRWVDQGTVWYRVRPVGKRAVQEARLLHKGDAVIVAGTQTIEEFTRKDGTDGYAIKVAADSIYVSRIPRKTDGE
ncbi:MAG: single-stranded DNA-binding protein [Bifidobacterium dentium]|nr:single-stranded DNA-binding protein [Bifidobacterium dentium]